MGEPNKSLAFFVGHNIDGKIYDLCDLVEKFGYRIIMAKGGGYRLIDEWCSYKSDPFTSDSYEFYEALELQNRN
jgi:hypothetical protein